MRRAQAVLLRATAVLPLLLGAGHAVEAKPPKPVEIVEVEDGDLLRLHRKDDPAAQGWLYRTPASREQPGTPAAPPAELPDLVVVLHGAGGTPKTLLFQALMQRRKAWCLGVAGHEAVTHDRGAGFMWDASNVAYVVELTQHVLAKHSVRKDRVIVWGHSAGGTMTLETLAKAPPGLFVGGLTTAAPGTPDGRHQDHRVAVILGTTDANWGGAQAVRSHVEGLAKKKGKGACAFFAVEGLGHEVPAEGYLDLGFDWLLAAGTRGGEAKVPQACAGRSGAWRHILVRTKGSTGAPDGAPSKKSATDLLKKVKKECEAGRAFFPPEAAVHSMDAASASGGGGLSDEALTAFLGALPDLAHGALSEPLESPHGVHLLRRE